MSLDDPVEAVVAVGTGVGAQPIRVESLADADSNLGDLRPEAMVKRKLFPGPISDIAMATGTTVVGGSNGGMAIGEFGLPIAFSLDTTTAMTTSATVGSSA